MKWIRIEAKHMTAHADVYLDRISTERFGCAPIIKYMGGWTFSQVREYCEEKGWDLFVFEKIGSEETKQIWPKVKSGQLPATAPTN